MYDDPVSKTRKIYLQMDEARDNTIIFDACITTLFNNHDRQSEFKPMSSKFNKVARSKLEHEQFDRI